MNTQLGELTMDTQSECVWSMNDEHAGEVIKRNMFDGRIALPICDKHFHEHKVVMFLLRGTKTPTGIKGWILLFLDRIRRHFVLKMTFDKQERKATELARRKGIDIDKDVIA